MSHFRLARISLILAALGLNATPALLTSAHAQAKPAAPAADAPKPETVRAEMFKLLDPAMVKELMTAKKYAEVQEKITAAEAFPNPTPYETYVITRMKLALGASSGNEAMTMAGLEASLTSGRLTPEEKANFNLALADIHLRAERYPKAIEQLKAYQALNMAPEKANGMLLRAYLKTNDYANAKALLLPALKVAETGGKPDADDLRTLAGVSHKLKDMTTYVQALEQLVVHAPSDDYWTDLLGRMQSKPTYNNRWSLDVYRLLNSTNKVMAPEEYTELTELALLAGQMTEAKQIVDQGYAAGVLGTGSNAAKHKQLRDKANKGAADDAKTIAGDEDKASKSKDGLALVNLGYAFVTMGQNDKGIALMEKGMAKAGFKRPDEPKLHMAIAYAKAGRKDEAIKILETLKGDDGLTDLAKYWMVHLKSTVATAAK
jgi:tetratricopeptide (TPR) repeat protein